MNKSASRIASIGMPLDKLASIIASLGVPGLILLIAISATGLAGGAAITTALASIGFGFGMIPGIAVLGVAALIAGGLAEFGFDTLYNAVLKELYRQGIGTEEILAKINRYHVSKGLKRKLHETVQAKTVESEQG